MFGPRHIAWNMSSVAMAGARTSVKGRPRSGLGEQVTAEKRPGRLLEDQARLPPVRHVRRIAPADALAAEIEDLPVSQGAGRPIGQVIE